MLDGGGDQVAPAVAQGARDTPYGEVVSLRGTAGEYDLGLCGADKRRHLSARPGNGVPRLAAVDMG